MVTLEIIDVVGCRRVTKQMFEAEAGTVSVASDKAEVIGLESGHRTCHL